MKRLRNRREAGLLLAQALDAHKFEPNLMVLGLPRGGVPVAYEIGVAFRASLDVFLVRKLGVPNHEELAMGAIASSGTRVLNHAVIDALEIPMTVVDQITAKETVEIQRREAVYRKGRSPLNVEGRTVLLVDDGLATGSTMLAALRSLRVQRPRKIIAAVPISPPSACKEVKAEADEMICLLTPEPFWGVGQWYDDFSQTSDDEVVQLLKNSQRLQESQAI